MRNWRNALAAVTAFRSRAGIVAPDVGGVAPRREIGDLELHLELLLPLVAALGRGLARGVGVVGQRHLAGEVLEDLEVLVGQGGAAGGDGLRYPRERERHHVGVALADHDLAAGDDLGLRPVQPVEQAALLVDRRLRGVLVLRALPAFERPPTEADGIAASVVDREHQPTAELVLERVRAVHEREPGPDDVVARELGVLQMLAESVELVG